MTGLPSLSQPGQTLDMSPACNLADPSGWEREYPDRKANVYEPVLQPRKIRSDFLDYSCRAQRSVGKPASQKRCLRRKDPRKETFGLFSFTGSFV